MRWLAVILGLAVWAAGPAMATPPRATMSDDRMVAATQSHLYVLRDVVDNIGSHYDELRDQYLVEISLETGEATRFWPLRRVAVSRLETGDLLNPGMVTERPGEVHDMMAVLRDAGAQPLSPSALLPQVLGNFNQGSIKSSKIFGWIARQDLSIATCTGCPVRCRWSVRSICCHGLSFR